MVDEYARTERGAPIFDDGEAGELVPEKRREIYGPDWAGTLPKAGVVAPVASEPEAETPSDAGRLLTPERRWDVPARMGVGSDEAPLARDPKPPPASVGAEAAVTVLDHPAYDIPELAPPPVGAAPAAHPPVSAVPGSDLPLQIALGILAAAIIVLMLGLVVGVIVVLMEEPEPATERAAVTTLVA